ncbi:basic salivary proline-rich protein 2-like [Suncus etruscus]|uniref:basic salivary proline-rich protein 2-like n=1 Tax=Suncus etruscus TaxID=109475 RepID=UPI002110608F|nr:basic salivary proline-rich protein 2-like [Suncus etruscus]
MALNVHVSEAAAIQQSRAEQPPWRGEERPQGEADKGAGEAPEDSEASRAEGAEMRKIEGLGGGEDEDVPPGGAGKGALSHPEVKASLGQLPRDKCSLEGQVEEKADSPDANLQTVQSLEPQPQIQSSRRASNTDPRLTPCPKYLRPQSEPQAPPPPPPHNGPMSTPNTWSFSPKHPATEGSAELPNCERSARGLEPRLDSEPQISSLYPRKPTPSLRGPHLPHPALPCPSSPNLLLPSPNWETPHPTAPPGAWGSSRGARVSGTTSRAPAPRLGQESPPPSPPLSRPASLTHFAGSAPPQPAVRGEALKVRGPQPWSPRRPGGSAHRGGDRERGAGCGEAETDPTPRCAQRGTRTRGAGAGTPGARLHAQIYGGGGGGGGGRHAPPKPQP